MKKAIIFILLTTIFLTLLTANENLLNYQTYPQQKSAAQAMLMSAVIPGSGQMYLGKNTRAGVFMAADITAILSLIRFDKEKNNLTENSKTFAYANAGLQKGVSDEIYRLAHNYRSSDEYNRSVILYARNRFIIQLNDKDLYDQYLDIYLLKPEESWDWNTENDYQEYRNIRKEKQNYEIYANFAIGALIINRLISVVDSALQTGKVNRASQVYAVPNFDTKGISLVYEYKF